MAAAEHCQCHTAAMMMLFISSVSRPVLSLCVSGLDAPKGPNRLYFGLINVCWEGGYIGTRTGIEPDLSRRIRNLRVILGHDAPYHRVPSAEARRWGL